MHIERWDPRRDGPLSESALQHKLEARGYSTITRSYPAGSVIAAQPESRERIDAVVSGLIKVTVDGDAAILSPGDIVFIPAGVSRRLEALGAAPARCLEGLPTAD